MDLDTSSEKRTANIHPVWTLTVTDIAGLLNSAYNRTGKLKLIKYRNKLGLDFGQDFLKVTIQPEYSNSIKDLLIIWLSSVPEKYHNFQAIFTFHEFRRLLSDFKVSITIDLKAALIAFGIMPCRHPCPWCTWDERDNLEDFGKWELRGISQHSQLYQQFCTATAPRRGKNL